MTRQHWMKSSKHTAFRPVLSNLRSRRRYTWENTWIHLWAHKGQRRRDFQVICWDFTVYAPEDSGCSRKWWGLLATRIGLSFLTYPCGKHLISVISSCANPELCKHFFISTLQVRKCKYLSKALKQFCQSTTYLQRAPNSEKQISPDLSLSKRPDNGSVTNSISFFFEI